MLDGFNAFDIGQQQPATIIFSGQHDAVTLRVQLRRRGDFLQREKHTDLEAQTLQFMSANRRKTTIQEGGITRYTPRFLGGVRKMWCQCADATAQFPSRTTDGNEDAVPLAQNALRRDCRFFRIAAERGFDRAPRDLRKRLSGFGDIAFACARFMGASRRVLRRRLVQDCDAVTDAEGSFVAQHLVADGVPVDRRGRNERGVHRVFRCQILQLGIEVLQLVIVPGSQTFDECAIKLLCLRMKARRRAGLQAMAHVAAGHHGHAPARAPCRAGDGPAQIHQTRFSRIIEANHDRWPTPAGIGQVPQGHDCAVIEFRITQPPDIQTAQPGLLRDGRSEGFVGGQIHGRRRRAELGQRAADPPARPDRKSHPPPRRVR